MTAGGSQQAYRAEGYNHFTLRELLTPLEQTARLTGMHYLPPFALFGSRSALEEGRIPDHVADWQRLLQALRDDAIDLERAVDLPQLNHDLNALMGAPA